MQTLFNLAANETTAGSVYYLGTIFGPMGLVLPGAGSALLGHMFNTMNTAVLALGTLIVTYTTVISILMTAHEGEMLGKKFHSLWVPLRTVLGISALVPTATGYSYLQLGMMWFILQGVGAADKIWETAVNYVAEGGALLPAGPGQGGADALLKGEFGRLFQMMTCQAAAKANYPTRSDIAASPQKYYCYGTKAKPTRDDSFCTRSDGEMLDINGPQNQNGVYSVGPGGACGTLSNLTTVQKQALQVILPSLGSIAKQLVDVDHDYFIFKTTVATPAAPVTTPGWVSNYCAAQSPAISPCTAGKVGYPVPTNTDTSAVKSIYWPYAIGPVTENFIKINADLYAAMMASNATGGGNTLGAVQSASINDGWMFAGTYFYAIASVNSKVQASVSTIQGMDIKNISGTDSLSTLYSNLNFVALKIVEQMPVTSGGGSGLSGMSIQCGDFMGIPYTGGFCSSLIGSWMNTLSGSSSGTLTKNPMIAAQSFGHYALLVVEIAYPLLLLAMVLLSPLGLMFPFGIGLPEMPMIMEFVLVPICMFFIVLFLGIGLTLAVYTPMIPYMLFFFGIINWIIACVETMIAAPLVAIGFLYPEGQSEIWGKAEHAMMLILNIFLRPSLMIFGLLAGMLMSFTVISILNATFQGAVAMVMGGFTHGDWGGGGAAGAAAEGAAAYATGGASLLASSAMSGGATILEVIFFMVLYTSLFITSLNKCYDLIHIIPDKVMRWIGGGGEQFGEGGGLDKVGESFKGAVHKAEGAAEGGVKQAQGAADKKEKRDKDNKPPPTSPTSGSSTAGSGPTQI